MLEQLGHIHLFVWMVETAHQVWLRVCGVSLKVQDVYPHCVELSVAGVSYKSKLRVILTNESKDTLIVSPAIWDSRPEGLPIQIKPVHPSEPQENKPASSLNLESASGWHADPDPSAWQPESLRIEVPPNRTFKVWVGLKLDEPSAERRSIEIRRRRVQGRLGTLVLPIRKWHSKHDLRFRLRM
jgi:hypothetical protein